MARFDDDGRRTWGFLFSFFWRLFHRRTSWSSRWQKSESPEWAGRSDARRAKGAADRVVQSSVAVGQDELGLGACLVLECPRLWPRWMELERFEQGEDVLELLSAVEYSTVALAIEGRAELS